MKFNLNPICNISVGGTKGKKKNPKDVLTGYCTVNIMVLLSLMFN